MNAQPLLVDTAIFVNMERQPGWLADWISHQADVATCDVVRAEFLVGVHAPIRTDTREKANRFFIDVISAMPSLPVEHVDFDQAGRLIGEAIRNGKGKPTLGDGLIGALALRTGRTVATDNTKDFDAMGVQNLNPMAKTPAPATRTRNPD